MSLLKLLSTGKSLVGLKNTASPYRMRAGNLLPKFGSPKNPFQSSSRTDAKTPASNAPTQMEADSLFDSKPKAELPRSVPVPKETKPATPALKFEPKPASPAPAAQSAKPRGSLAGWIKKFNPLAHLPKRQPRGGTVKPKAARAVVQGELSLEKVRPIRNELNDSDLEIITVKPAPTGTGGSILPSLPRPRLTTWGRLTSRALTPAETQAH